MDQTNEPNFRAGYVAIVGEPNVGKSTLMNRLVGARLSIVTRKPQTTRKSVLGIVSNDDAQIVFVDTPGVLTPAYLLQEKLVGYVADAVRDADVILLMLDANHPTLERIAATPLGDVREFGKPVILLLNKMDAMVRKEEALPIIERFAAMDFFEEIVPVSALDGENTDRIIPSIIERLPKGHPFYDPDVLSRQPERFFVAEMIREQILLGFRKEIPYSVEVDIIEFKEREQPQKTFIHAEIVVERETQKGILIGKKGEALRNLGSASRKTIEEFLDRPIYLELFVKVRKNWRSDENRLNSYGY